LQIKIPTPIEEFIFRNRKYFIKRDDLTHPFFSGNKARKLWSLLQKDFTPYTKIISYGSAQSNAMLSLSYLAKIKGVEFDYYVSHIAPNLQSAPYGNYKMALENGMNLKFFPLPFSYKEDELFIPEGGFMKDAEIGIAILAEEIKEWIRKNNKKIDIFLPSGTGTTALFLQKNLMDFGVRVYTTPCVKDKIFLKGEFLKLCKDEDMHPIIIDTKKKYRFARLYKEFYEIWQELKEAGIEFELVYDPKGWICLLENENIFDHEILYIHQGGLFGNESMLIRYKNKFF